MIIPTCIYHSCIYIVLIFGILLFISVCILLSYRVWWRVLELSKRGKRWHAYIKEHKHEFVAWHKEWNKKKRRNLNRENKK